jgi:photosystem II stability/assembly factor-like uncharacterized protein
MKLFHSYTRKIFLLIFLLFNLLNPVSAQWITLNSGTSNSLNRVDFPSLNVGYVLPFSGPLLRTVDGGITWDSLTSLSLWGDLLFDNNIYFVDDSIGFISTHNSNGNVRLYKTSDMGNSWTDLTPDSNLWGIIKIHFLNHQRGYIYVNSAFNDRAWTTIDGGLTWTELTLGFTFGSGTSSLPTMFFVNDSTGYCAGGDGSFLYRGAVARTTDYGQNWSIIIFPNNYSLINSIHFPNQDTGYTVSRSGKIFRSIDEGLSWDSIATLNTNTKSEIFFIDGKTGFVVSDVYLYKTIDAGITWFIDFTTTNGVNLFAVDFPDSTTGYAVGSNGTILKNLNPNGIENINSNDNFITVYPNPLTNSSILEVNVQLKDPEVFIYNIFGKEMMRKKLTANRMEIGKGNLKPGVYFVRVKDNEGEYMKKIIVE